MSSSPSLSNQTDQRLLAAIVFSDVVGFSSRMEAREAATLALLERDFAAMREFSTVHSGTVIKTTGDGLMLFFNSAVQAVEWALKTQRHFAEEAAKPGAEVLLHRIGIHLGDVFVSGGDVMGDGVNVAARVQAEARPGGICISEVVYGVVKNKLEIDVLRLEPRKLKNISESVRMYHVMLEPPVRKPPAPVRTLPAPELAAPAPRPDGRSLIFITLLVVVLGAAGAWVWRDHMAHENQLASSEKMRTALGAAVRSEKEAVGLVTQPARRLATDRTAEEFDFLKMTTSRPPVAGVSPAQDLAVRSARDAINLLEVWRTTAMQPYTRNRPLAVTSLRGSGYQRWTVFTDANQQLYVAEGGAERSMPWSRLKPEVQGAILASLLSHSPAPSRDILRGAEAFAFVHGLPELAAVLARR